MASQLWNFSMDDQNQGTCISVSITPAVIPSIQPTINDRLLNTTTRENRKPKNIRKNPTELITTKNTPLLFLALLRARQY